MKREISISRRLTVWFGGIFFLGWVLFGTSMWLDLQRTLKNERQLTLSRRLDRLQELLIKDKDSSSTDRIQDFQDFAHATGNGLAEILHPDGSRAFPSPSKAASAFPWPAVQSGDRTLFRNVTTGDQSYWVMARPSFSGEPLILMAAAPEAGNLLVLHSFLVGLLASAPILLLVSSGAGYWVSRRALMPVDQITATARSISIRNISDRLPVTQTGDELQRLAETCNAMLGRLETSVNQIKRFTADASHELRGPLSFTRTVAEVALRNPQVDPESRRALQDIVDEVAKAAILLEEMLTLARADSLPASLPRVEVNLAGLVKEVCELAKPIATDRRLTLSCSAPARETIVLGDPPALRRLIWILLDNAMKYSRDSGAISVSVIPLPGKAQMVVSDNGIGIPAVDLPFIFDRFYRADPSRSMVEGSGLGLAIAKWIAETHQAKISVESDPASGTAFTVEFPVCGATDKPFDTTREESQALKTG